MHNARKYLQDRPAIKKNNLNDLRVITKANFSSSCVNY
jgi:hypothetical protein